MASRFSTVSKYEILAVTEAATPKNTTRKKKNWLVAHLLLGRKNFLAELAKNLRETPR